MVTARFCAYWRTPLWLRYIWATPGRHSSKASGTLHLNDTVTNSCHYDCWFTPDHFWFCFAKGDKVLVGQTIAWRWEYDPNRNVQTEEAGRIGSAYRHEHMGGSNRWERTEAEARRFLSGFCSGLLEDRQRNSDSRSALGPHRLSLAVLKVDDWVRSRMYGFLYQVPAFKAFDDFSDFVESIKL